MDMVNGWDHPCPSKENDKDELICRIFSEYLWLFPLSGFYASPFQDVGNKQGMKSSRFSLQVFRPLRPKRPQPEKETKLKKRGKGFYKSRLFMVQGPRVNVSFAMIPNRPLALERQS